MFVGITLDKVQTEESLIKIRRRTKIKNIAEKLFVEQGISNTSTQQIAEVAGIGRRTIYHYYNSKEEIAIEVQEDFIKKLQNIEGLEKSIIQFETGIEKLEYILNALVDHYLKYLEELEYLNEFDKNFKNVEALNFTPLELENYNIYNCLYSSLENGISDGSVRFLKESDIKNIILTINHALIAFISRIGLRLELIETIYGYGVKDCKLITSLIINGLRK